MQGVGFPAVSCGSLGVVNALFDRGAPRERRARVLGRKKLTGQSNSHPYRRIVRSWLPGIQEQEIIVEGDLWRTNPKQVIVLEKALFEAATVDGTLTARLAASARLASRCDLQHT